MTAEGSEETKHRILVAEDDPVFRRIACQILRRRGYMVTEAGSGEEALEALTRETPDLLLLDLQFAGIGGLDVYRKFRDQNPGVIVPTIFISGSGALGEQEVRGLGGPYGFLAKPVRSQELVAKVEAFLPRE